MTRPLLVLVASILGLSCASARAPLTMEQIALVKRSIPVCESADDCRRMWDAARQWIAEHACCEIKTLTDDLILTHDPPRGSPRIGVRVTREYLGDGRYRAVPYAWCDSSGDCVPRVVDALLNLNLVMGLAKQQPSFAPPSRLHSSARLQTPKQRRLTPRCSGQQPGVRPVVAAELILR